MIAWLIVQENKITGEVNQTIAIHADVVAEDYAIRSGTWKDCPIEITGVEIKPLDPAHVNALKLLENRSYRSDGFVDSEESFFLAPDDKVTSALHYLKEQYS